jgi:hypothetical protein
MVAASVGDPRRTCRAAAQNTSSSELAPANGIV